MASLYYQRHAAKQKYQQPWCEMAVVPPVNSSDFTNPIISLSDKWVANLALQGSSQHAVASLHFSFTPFPLVKATLIQPTLNSSQLGQQNFYQLLLYSEKVVFLLQK